MRIPGIDPAKAEGAILAVLKAQAERWGAPLINHLLYERRPSIFRGARAVWTIELFERLERQDLAAGAMRWPVAR